MVEGAVVLKMVVTIRDEKVCLYIHRTFLGYWCRHYKEVVHDYTAECAYYLLNDKKEKSEK